MVQKLTKNKIKKNLMNATKCLGVLALMMIMCISSIMLLLIAVSAVWAWICGYTGDYIVGVTGWLMLGGFILAFCITFYILNHFRLMQKYMNGDSKSSDQ